MRRTHVEAPRFDTTTWIQQENIWLRLPRESWQYLFEHVKIKGHVAVFVLCSAHVQFYLPGGRWLNVHFLWQRWSHLPFTYEIKTWYNTCLSHFPPLWMPFLLFWSVLRLYYNICALWFLYCQDTVMALQALSIYATINNGESIDLTITVNGAFGVDATFNIDRSNYLLQQSQDLPVCI